MEKQDLREYGEAELSNMVYNDEGLYRMRFMSYLTETLDQCFLYTDEQLEYLNEAIEEEENEE